MRKVVGEVDLPIPPEDLMWLAGILEGEGSFGCWGGAPVITLPVTDRDIVERIAGIAGGAHVGIQKPKTSKHRDVFYTQVSGARARSAMRQILPLMGERRRAKISDVLRMWDERK